MARATYQFPRLRFKLAAPVFLALGLLTESVLALPCSEPYIALTTQLEVDNFQTIYGPGCDEVSSRLTIDGDTITNLDGLIKLVSVGELRILNGASLNSLHGLSNVAQIGTDLWISGLDHITSLAEFASLNTVGDNALIVENDGLQYLGLSALTTVGGSLHFEDNPNLAELRLSALIELGGLSIFGSNSMESLDIPPQLTTIGEMHVVETTNLTNLGGLENLQHIEGELHIYQNAALGNLDGLSGLEAIGGDFIIGSNPEQDYLGLPSLNAVGGDIDIANLANLHGIELGALASVDHLTIRDNDALVEIGNFAPSGMTFNYIQIQSNPMLRNLDGFSVLGPDIKSLNIWGNASLEDLDGLINITSAISISVRESPLLTDLVGLSSLQTLHGGLSLSLLDGITNLDDLAGLNLAAGGIAIEDNPNLQSVNLDSLGWTNNLNISGNASLENLDGLAQLQALGNITISENESLLNIDGLGSLDGAIDDLEIADNPSLQNLDGLDDVQLVDGHLTITGNQSLENLDGLGSVFYITGFNTEISNNASLISISGLASVGFVLGTLEIENNQSLTEIAAFNDVNGIEGRLDIAGNASLERIGGFSNLTAVHSNLSVWNNPLLSDCTALRMVLDDIDDAEPGPGSGDVPDVGGFVRLESNAFGCNSIFESFGGLLKSGFE